MVLNNVYKWLGLLFLSLLIAGCGGGGGDSDTTDSGAADNSAPIVNVDVSSSVIVANQTFTITAQASDNDGQISSYQWQQLSGPEFTFTANGNVLTVTAPNVQSDTDFSFSVVVTDNDGATTEQVFSGTVTVQNTPPTVNITGPSSALANTQVNLIANAQDIDGTISSIVWEQSSGPSVEFSQTEAELSFTAPNVSNNETLGFSVTVIDNAGGTAQSSTTVIITQLNSAPSVTLAGPDEAMQNESVTITATTQDSDGTISELSWQQTNGPVVEFTQAESSITFTAPTVAQNTNITFLATVKDNDDATNSAQITVIVMPPNNPPVADDATVEVQYNLSAEFNLTVSDPDGDTVQIIFPDDLEGAQVSIIDAQTLRFSYTPPLNSISAKSYTLIASDGEDSTNFLLNTTIVDTSPATVVSITPDDTAELVLVDTPISMTFSDVMLRSSLTVNDSAGSCGGSIQVSSDDFASCVALNIESVSGGPEQTNDYFKSVSLSADFLENTAYKVRVNNQLVNFFGTAATATEVSEFTTSTQDLKITELISVQFSNDTPWVEIYNGTGAAVNLQNYSLKTRAINMLDSSVSAEQVFTLPNKVIENGSYVLLQSRFGDEFLASAALNNPKIVLVGNQNDALRPYWYINGFAELLNSAATQTIDFVRFGNSTQQPVNASQWQSNNAPAMQAEQGSSLKRALDLTDTNQASDWTYSVFNTPAAQNDVSCDTDADIDGIPDCAEQEGSTFGGLPLYEWGARENQKDIFIEIDYMDSSDAGITPQRIALEKVVSVFASNGYTVHFDVGDLFDQSIGISANNFDLGGGSTVPFNRYTPFEYNQGSANLFAYKMEYADTARRPIFHYLLMANSGNPDGSISGSGIAEINGNDLMLTMGGWGLSVDDQTSQNVTNNYQASTIFHELGHNLGLYHGGDEEVNFKPNHLSSMNYLYQLTGLATIGDNEGDRYYDRFYTNNINCDLFPNTNNQAGPTDDFIIDYSNGSAADINESAIDESAGLNRAGSEAVDYNCNAILGDALTNFDANQDSQITILTDVDEWGMIDLQFYAKSAGNRFGAVNMMNQNLFKRQSVTPVSSALPSYIKEAPPSEALINQIKAIKEQ